MEDEEDEAEVAEEEAEEEGNEQPRTGTPGVAMRGKGGGVVVPPPSCLTQRGAKHATGVRREIVRAEARGAPAPRG